MSGLGVQGGRVQAAKEADSSTRTSSASGSDGAQPVGNLLDTMRSLTKLIGDLAAKVVQQHECARAALVDTTASIKQLQITSQQRK